MTEPTVPTPAEVLERAELFRATLEQYYADHNAASGFDVYVTRFALEVGTKNIRVVQSEEWPNKAVNTGRSVYCFIDKASGDLLKAASFKIPAKGARGNIFNENCDVGVRADMYGSGLYRR